MGAEENAVGEDIKASIEFEMLIDCQLEVRRDSLRRLLIGFCDAAIHSIHTTNNQTFKSGNTGRKTKRKRKTKQNKTTHLAPSLQPPAQTDAFFHLPLQARSGGVVTKPGTGEASVPAVMSQGVQIQNSVCNH